jgi:uncharacterized Zn-binding protein involved in type VI secretion
MCGCIEMEVGFSRTGRFSLRHGSNMDDSAVRFCSPCSASANTYIDLTTHKPPQSTESQSGDQGFTAIRDTRRFYMRPFICVGDKTSHGGIVLSGAPTSTTMNRQIARVDDLVSCPRCGDNRIATGDPSMIIMGKAVARAGDRTECGAILVSSQSVSGSQISHPFFGSSQEAYAPPSPPSEHAADSSGSPNAKADKPVEEKTCTIRIGVFFDGTNNNATNTALGTQCRASTSNALGESGADTQAISSHCKPYMLDANSSYANGNTNIERLYELYRNDADKHDEIVEEMFFSRIYVDGIGTTAGKADTPLPGMAFGTGETGMIARVQQVLISSIPEQLNAFGDNYPDTKIRSLEFDIFGFSRGAAAARHFVNELKRNEGAPLRNALSQKPLLFVNNFDWRRSVQINFVGLFDTVSARGSLSDGFDIRSGETGALHVALLADCARRVVQICARDEIRANFMLTTVRPEHLEIAMPGVHSDIGGSYHDDSEGPLLLTKPISSVEAFQHMPDGAHLPDPTQSQAWQNVEQQRQAWKSHLGNLDDHCLTVDSWTWIEHKHSDRTSITSISQPRVYAAVRLERPIDWRYQLMPLRLMHKLGKEAGVGWGKSPDDIPDMALPHELEPIAAKLLTGQPLDSNEEALLSRKYLHQSANWNFEMAGKHLGRGPVSLELVYVNRPDPSGHRVVLRNQ